MTMKKLCTILFIQINLTFSGDVYLFYFLLLSLPINKKRITLVTPNFIRHYLNFLHEINYLYQSISETQKNVCFLSAEYGKKTLTETAKYACLGQSDSRSK